MQVVRGEHGGGKEWEQQNEGNVSVVLHLPKTEPDTQVSLQIF